MIIIIIRFILAAMATYYIQTINPVKIRAILIATGVIIFNVIYFITRNLWFPIIIYLMFIGGILIIFILLSSILPNEKTYKNFKRIWLIIIFTLTFLLSTDDVFYTVVRRGIKTLMASSLIIFFIFLIITAYFLVVMTIVTHSRLPLRRANAC